MEQILQQILNELKEVKTNQVKTDSRFEQLQLDVNARLEQLQSDVNDIKLDMADIKAEVKSISEQTHNLLEFRTETRMTLDTISQEIDFINHKELQNEKDLFTLKKNLQLIK